MRAESVLPVPQAAARLGVNSTRVRTMIRSNLLEAQKVGGRWLVDAASVDRRREAAAPAGRGLTELHAWAVLFLAAGDAGKLPTWIKEMSPSERSRIRSRLKNQGLASFAPRLRGRAEVRRLRAHPSDVPIIAEERGVVRGGVSAAADYRIDIVAPGEVELYVPAKVLPRLIKKYFLEPNANPNVTLHVVDGFWPFSPSTKVVPSSVAAIDLVEADDERSRRAGKELLERMESKW